MPNGKDEIYTSCLDIEMIPKIEIQGVTFQPSQDLNVAAIKNQLR